MFFEFLKGESNEYDVAQEKGVTQDSIEGEETDIA
jgi:hypothetical protein